jgi:3-isopropylmalate/(R)-2-methylmalate dehydratase large subunit
VDGKTTSEKILARASGAAEASAGDIVEASPDIVMSHENTFLVNKAFSEFGLERPWDPDKIVVVLDHRTPANTAATASVHSKIRDIVKGYGIKRFYDAGEGICHQILVEERLICPGHLALGTDSHTTTSGALGAFATGIGATEMAGVWATGSLWLKVPQTFRLELSGHLQKGTYAKDIALRLAAVVGPSGADYRCMEFAGPLMQDLPMASRMVLCNMATEVGAKAATIEVDTVTREWFRGSLCSLEGSVTSDPDARFERKIEIDVTKLPPMVAGPHSVDAANTVERFEGIRIDQAFIGTCTNGRLEDLTAAAQVLKGRKVAPGCRLIVAPASRKVMVDAIDVGAAQTIMAAGGTFLPPGCGPCLGAHAGVLGPDEVCVSSSNRNFRGRMGSEEAEIYLASPATVAASAVKGSIADPRGLL